MRKYSRSKSVNGSLNLDLERVLENNELSWDFCNFLKKTLNEDAFLFVKDCETFRQESDPKVRNGLANSIYNKYIKSGSPQEINIDSSTRESICSIITDAEKSECSIGCCTFDSISSRVISDLKNDGFIRYVETKRTRTYSPVDSKPRNSLSLTELNSFILFSPSFDEKTIVKKDIDELQNLERDKNLWYFGKHKTKKDASDNSVSSFIFEQPIHSEDGRMFMLSKFTGIVPRSAQQVILAMIELSNRKMWDCSYKSDTLIHFTKSRKQEEFSVSLTQYTYKVNAFSKMRECMKMSTLAYDETRRCYMWVSKTTSAYGHDPSSKNIFVDFCSLVTITPVSPKLCKYAITHVHLLGGHEKEVHFITVNKRSEKNLHDGLLQIFSKPVVDSCDNNRLSETFDVYKS